MIILLLALAFQEGAPFVFERIVLNEKSDFEAAGVADFDRDGDLDIVCGDTIYLAPDWKRSVVAEIRKAGGYRVDFANVPLDVDGDGWTDVVSCSWHDRTVLWRRNPGEAPGPAHWTQRAVETPGNMETALAVDVDGDGVLDFLPDVTSQVVWYRCENGGLREYTVSTKMGGHGIGFGDVNGDGRGDLLKPGGWFEAPEDRRGGDWTWHREWDLGQAGIGILVHDFTGDGLADVVYGQGHDYGVYWLEQKPDASGPERWQRREIDRTWSQSHALVLADFDRDGVPEILTGKRRFAHNGNDPGGREEQLLVLYRYRPGEKSFERHTLHRGDLDGTGLAPVVIDLDQDGDLDVVCPGKGGLYLYLQRR